MPDGLAPILDVEDLRVVFHMRQGAVHAVNSVSFTVRPGEVLGVVGESGSGKSAAMMSILGLLSSPPAEVVSKRVLFDGADLYARGNEGLRVLRGGEIGFVFQDPMTSLNPVLSIGYQLAEPMRLHLGLSRRAARARAAELLSLVGLPDPKRRLDQFPHELSGGQRQRVMIAMALGCEPRLLIADEPTTALDVTIQAQILELLRGLQQKLGMAMVWIAHDLGVIAGIADRVLVMYAGQIVEHAPATELFARPAHPYTRALIDALPRTDGPRSTKLSAIPGQPPVLHAPPAGCPFRPRCAQAFEACEGPLPGLRATALGHEAACYRVPLHSETSLV